MLNYWQIPAVSARLYGLHNVINYKFWQHRVQRRWWLRGHLLSSLGKLRLARVAETYHSLD
jgi:hypothetical protein